MDMCGKRRPVNLIPYTAPHEDGTRVPRTKGWGAFSRFGDPQVRLGELSDQIKASVSRPRDYWAWAILPGQARLVVIDCDNPELESALIDLYGDTPVKVRSPSGGVHMYYITTHPVTSHNNVRGRGEKSYDVKSDGVTVHCPGQWHHRIRGQYTVEAPRDFHIEDFSRLYANDAVGELRKLLPAFRADVAEAEWVAHNPKHDHDGVLNEHMLTGTIDERAALARYMERAGPAVSSRGGHDHTRGLLLKIGDFGLPENIAADLAAEWDARNEPPWGEKKIREMVADAYATRTLPIGWRAGELSIKHEASDGDTDDAEQAEMSDDDTTKALADAVASLDKGAAPALAVAPRTAEGYDAARKAALKAKRSGGDRRAVLDAAMKTAVLSTLDYREILQEVFAGTALPHVDVRDLFADCPAAIDQCFAVQESVRAASADVPALFALGFASAALAARCLIDIEPHWQPPPHIFAVASVPSGGGKSAFVSRMGEKLIRKWQSEIGREWEDIARIAGVKRGTARALYADYERQTVRIRKAIDNSVGVEQLSHKQALANIESRMDAVAAEITANSLRKPIWLQADSTPEKFVDLTKEFGFSLLVAGEGATILQAFTQGSTGRNRVTALLSGWTGEAMDRARVGGGMNSVERIDRYSELHTCMVLPVQSFLFQPGGTSVTDRERSTTLKELAAAGFFARCLIAREEVTGICEAPVEFDGTWKPSLKAQDDSHVVAAQDAWDRVLSDIWYSGLRAPPAQPLAPEKRSDIDIIAVSEDARKHLLNFQVWANNQRHPGGQWSADQVAESAARIGEQAMRVAAVIACMRARSSVGVEITLAEAERAVRFSKDYAMPLAENLLERAKPDPIADDAEVVVKKVADCQRRKPGYWVERRALHQRLGRGWGKTSENARLSRLDVAIEHAESVGRLIIDRAEGRISKVSLPAKK